MKQKSNRKPFQKRACHDDDSLTHCCCKYFVILFTKNIEIKLVYLFVTKFKQKFSSFQESLPLNKILLELSANEWVWLEAAIHSRLSFYSTLSLSIYLLVFMQTTVLRRRRRRRDEEKSDSFLSLSLCWVLNHLAAAAAAAAKATRQKWKIKFGVI